MGWRGKEWKLYSPEAALSVVWVSKLWRWRRIRREGIFSSHGFAVEGEGTKGIQDNLYGLGLQKSTTTRATNQDGEDTLRNQSFDGL